jgi:hypothetical protein
MTDPTNKPPRTLYRKRAFTQKLTECVAELRQLGRGAEVLRILQAEIPISNARAMAIARATWPSDRKGMAEVSITPDPDVMGPDMRQTPPVDVERLLNALANVAPRLVDVIDDEVRFRGEDWGRERLGTILVGFVRAELEATGA